MIKYYCPYCDTEAFWDEDCQGFRCFCCNKFLTEDEILMLYDDNEDL